MLKQSDITDLLQQQHDIVNSIVRSKILNGISDISICSGGPKRFHGHEFMPDSDLPLSVKVCGQHVAFSGLSYGLDDYYCMDSTHPRFREREKYGRIIDCMGSAPVITEMQAIPGTLALRDSIDWRRALTEVWEELVKMDSQGRGYILPKDLNYWRVPSVQEQLIERPHFAAPDSVFKANYDNNAARCGYTPNPEKHGVFEKQLN